MCLFLRNPSLLKSATIESVFSSFHYKIASIIFNNIQTSTTPLFSETEFILQVLKQCFKSIELTLNKEVNKIAEQLTDADNETNKLFNCADVRSEFTERIAKAQELMERQKSYAGSKEFIEKTLLRLEKLDASTRPSEV